METRTVIDVDTLRDAIQGPRLSTERRFQKFLNSTQYFNKAPDPIRTEAPPSYYVEMTEQEQDEHEIQIEFFTAAKYKKSPPPGMPPTLETLSKCPEMNGGLATQESAQLYYMPGVRKTLELYVKYFDSDEILANRTNEDGTIEGYSLRTANNREEVTLCREVIRDRILDDVKQGLVDRGQSDLSDDEIETRARVAEQSAFAMGYVGGLFEGMDSKWNNMGRVRAGACFNDCVSVPIKIAMRPLDQLVSTFKKGTHEIKPHGRFGLWGWKQALSSNGGRPPKIQEIKFLANEDAFKLVSDYWRVSNNGKTIIIPECYPRKLLGSVFEETKVSENGSDRDLLSYLRAEEEIPWDKVTDTMWSDYSSKIAAAGFLNDVLLGNIPISWGDQDKYTKWGRDVEDKLAKFNLRNADRLKRWLLYAAMGVNVDKRDPQFQNRMISLSIATAFGSNGSNYLSTDSLFFRKDK